MERNFVSERAYSVNGRRPADRRSLTDKSRCEVASALTKEAFWVVILLSSLGLWAAIWAAAASMISAWLQ